MTSTKERKNNMANVTYPILVWDNQACERRVGRSTVLAPLNGVTPWAIGKGEPGERYGQILAEAAIYESEK